MFLLHRSPLLQMEEEKKEHGQKMKKMEAEMEQVFEMKVKEKMQKLKDSEADVRRTMPACYISAFFKICIPIDMFLLILSV